MSTADEIVNAAKLAAAAWHALDPDPGPLITERTRPLADSTMTRIRATLDRYPDDRLIVSYYGSSRVGRPASQPLPMLTTHDRHAVATRTPRGIAYRMLSVAEQAAAMGFPETYRWCGTRADRVKQIGNAVCPPAARDVLAGLTTALGEVAA